eukprot:3209742-Rhodomonas_salina.2
MSGTELAYVAIFLRVCYAISGTELAYGAISLRVCYAVSATELASVPIFPSRFAALNKRVVLSFLRAVRYCASLDPTYNGGVQYFASNTAGNDPEEAALQLTRAGLRPFNGCNASIYGCDTSVYGGDTSINGCCDSFIYGGDTSIYGSDTFIYRCDIFIYRCDIFIYGRDALAHGPFMPAAASISGSMLYFRRCAAVYGRGADKYGGIGLSAGAEAGWR